MTELGHTTDPTVLIPGEPKAVEGRAEALREYGQALSSVGEDLKRIDVAGWTGQASAAFMDLFSREPPKWLKSSDALESVSRALVAHANTLRWAQEQASEAITIWEHGEATTQEATQEHNAAVARANADSGTVGPFSDPGEQYRQQARQLLIRARDQLGRAGVRTADSISGHGNRQGDDALSGLVDAVTSGFKDGRGKAEASALASGFGMSGPKDGKLGELKTFAQLGKASVEGSISNAFHTFSGRAEASAEAAATLSASFTDEGLKARAEASIGAKASAEGRVQTGVFGHSAKVEGFFGANAGAHISASPTGLNAAADAFAGGKATVKGGADVGGIGVNATAEGWAGPGAEAGLTAGADENGVWRLSANAGISPIVGGKAGFEVTVDPDEVAETVGDAAEAVGNAGEAIGDAAGSAQRTISGWLY